MILVPLEAGAATSVPAGEVVARVDGQAVTRGEAEALVSGELAELDRQRHQLLERAVERVIEDRLLELEARRRGLPLDSLLAEIEAAVGEVSEGEIDSWYQRNQARIRQPKAQVEPQIRAFLENERRQAARAAKVDALRQRFAVESLLEPLRVALDLTGVAALGPADAKVTVVEFGDFQCPPCGRIFGELKKLKQEYGDRVRFVFEHFPLESIHPRARAASTAAVCAGEQGKFWQMHDALFGAQAELADADLHRHADLLGLDGEEFTRCLASDSARAAVDRALEAGRVAGVSGTPTLFVNGRPAELQAGDVYPQLKALVDDELRRAGG